MFSSSHQSTTITSSPSLHYSSTIRQPINNSLYWNEIVGRQTATRPQQFWTRQKHWIYILQRTREKKYIQGVKPESKDNTCTCIMHECMLCMPTKPLIIASLHTSTFTRLHTHTCTHSHTHTQTHMIIMFYILITGN